MNYWFRSILLVLSALVSGTSMCLAGVPPLVSYQGKLTELTGQPVPDGMFSMRFLLYDQETGGNLIWQEPATGNPPTNVQVTGGLFNVLLGSAVPLAAGSLTGNSWLQVEVNAEPLTPRTRIVSSAYAIRASMLDLPFAASASTLATEFSLSNTGTGSAGFFGIDNAGSASPALEARTSGSGPALKATTTGTGNAAEFGGVVNVTGEVQMDSFKLRTSPAAGRVLTSDAAGVGTWQTPLPGTYTNVKAYGAKGDGVTDDTVAIRNAMTAAYSRSASGTWPGGPMYHSTPILFFPAGKYVISDAIAIAADILGEGAILYQTQSNKDILYSSSVWRMRISGMSFVGGKCHLSLFTGNVDQSQVSIDKCHFQRAADCAVRMQLGSNSTQVDIRDCVFTYCNQVFVNHCDLAKVYDCFIESASYMTNQAVIENYGCLLVENMHGVPTVTAGNDQRWIDNYGVVECRTCRFGGEYGGFTPIVNYFHYAYTYPIVPGIVALYDCQIYAAGNPGRKAAIYCEEIPNQIAIRDCTGFTDMPQAVQVRSTLDLNTYFDSAHPGYVTFLVDGNSAGASPGQFDLPTQMRPYLSGPKEADSVPTSGRWLAGNFVRNRSCTGVSGSPFGWLCVTSGKPGVWKTVNMTFGSAAVYRFHFDGAAATPAPNPYVAGPGDIMPAGVTGTLLDGPTNIVTPGAAGPQGGNVLEQPLGAAWPNQQGYRFGGEPYRFPGTAGPTIANTFTIEAIVKPDLSGCAFGLAGISYIYDASCHDGTQWLHGSGLYVNQNTGTVHLAMNMPGYGDISSTTALQSGQWYHIAVVVRGSGDASQRTELWINGTLDATGSYPAGWETQGLFVVPGYFNIGSWYWSTARNWQGQIDAFAISDTALSPGSFVLWSAT